MVLPPKATHVYFNQTIFESIIQILLMFNTQLSLMAPVYWLHQINYRLNSDSTA